jgi:hypothetical protein
MGFRDFAADRSFSGNGLWQWDEKQKASASRGGRRILVLQERAANRSTKSAIHSTKENVVTLAGRRMWPIRCVSHPDLSLVSRICGSVLAQVSRQADDIVR